MAGRLATILEKEYKSKGLVSGLASAGGKRLREIFDIRNLLFSGQGVGSLIGRKIFGKGYSAISDSDKLSNKVSPTVETPSSAFSQESVNVLLSIKKDTSLSAKNSIVLPQIARDMNLTKQNIMRIVKLQGGTSATRADMFFKRSAEREADYERRVGRMGSVTRNTPTQINKSEGFGLQGTILAILSAVGLLIAANWDKVKPYYDEFKGILYKMLGALVAISIARGAIAMPRRTPTPAPTPGGPASRVPTPAPTPGGPASRVPTPAPTPGGPPVILGPDGKPTPGGPASRVPTPAPTPGGPPVILGPDGKPLPPSGSAENKSKSKIVEKLKQLIKSPKAMSKFAMLMGKRGLGWIATALLFSGPVGWVVTALLAAMTIGDIMSIIDEAFKEDKQEQKTNETSSPSNLTEQKGEMADLIYKRFREAGFSDVQAKAAVANAMRESNLNPNAHNTKGEDSVGLFQMNRKGGLGEGYTVEQLKDPETNIKIAIDAAKKSKSFTQAQTIEDATTAFVKDVERPKDKIGETQKRIEIAQGLNTRFPGESINSASVGLNDANRTLAMTTTGPTVNQDNRTYNNQSSSTAHGMPNPFAYDRELVQSLLSNVT